MWAALVGLGCWAWARNQRRLVSGGATLAVAGNRRVWEADLPTCLSNATPEALAVSTAHRAALWAGLTFIAALHRWHRLCRPESCEEPWAVGPSAPVRAQTPAQWQVASDLSAGTRDVVIATSAALPWMTGTSINPLIRAWWLRKRGHRVTLLLPFLPPKHQPLVFAADAGVFGDPAAQEAYIRHWMLEKFGDDATKPTGHLAEIKILFYPSAHVSDIDSILPVGDMTKTLTDNHVVLDFCILEEPEHLTWYHYGRRWTSLFNFVLGIAHTNYIAYALHYGFMGPPKALVLHSLNRLVCRANCDRIIKLSGAVQILPKSVVCNVHGVQERFLKIGDTGASASSLHYTAGAYFLGKALWEKGYRQLLYLWRHHYRKSGESLPIVLYGGGPNLQEITDICEGESALSAIVLYGGGLDHGHSDINRYRVFVNPATSDVVCTATAEAIAMGKRVVLADHPSNEFFRQFRNATLCSSPESFIEAVQSAIAMKPEPLSAGERHALTWGAATDRLYEAARIPDGQHPPNGGRDRAISRVLYGVTKHLQKRGA